MCNSAKKCFKGKKQVIKNKRKGSLEEDNDKELNMSENQQIPEISSLPDISSSNDRIIIDVIKASMIQERKLNEI